MPYAMLTIGHSDRTIEDFLGILTQHRVAFLADVRKMPGSRKHPQFNDDALASSLATAGIGYEHFPGLGELTSFAHVVGTQITYPPTPDDSAPNG
jgi:uncharacterized protein (DUF488 family)